MAFDLNNLTPTVHVSGDQQLPVIWNYTTVDALATVEASSYYDTAAAIKALRQGDWIRVTASDGKAIYYVDGSDIAGTDISIIKQAVVSSFI